MNKLDQSFQSFENDTKIKREKPEEILQIKKEVKKVLLEKLNGINPNKNKYPGLAIVNQEEITSLYEEIATRIQLKKK
jgi:hypothetical protein